ncbi:ATP-binding protein [Antarctobacter sp.]|uniref:ATP-binding protein n=1 Tax=Antarctobacter sp. TaxID=1872577 RepID=UPI002B266EC4|nr:ATP-binding protein [Antarctobacter sp.]
MLTSIVHSLISLILAATLLYLVFSTARYSNQSRQTDIALGFAFGIVIMALSVNAHVFTGGAMLSSISGILIFSGYLGRIPGALIALSVALAIRIWVGGDMLPIGVLSLTCNALAGLVLRKLVPFKAWPAPPKAALSYGIGAYLLIQTSVVTIANLAGTTPQTDAPLRVVFTFTAVGCLSVVLVWFAISQSVELAKISRDNARLLKRMQHVMDHNNMGTFIFGDVPNQLIVDQGFLDLYGLAGSPGPLPMQTVLDMLHPEDRDEVIKRIGKAIDGETDSNTHDFRFYRADGSLRDARVVRAVEVDEATGEVRIVGFQSDLTDFRDAQRERNEAEHRISVIAENIPGVIYQAIWENGAPREVTYISQKCVDIFGVSHSAIMADNSLLRKGQDESTVILTRDSINHGIKTGEPVHVRLPINARDGTRRWVELHAKTTDLGDGTDRVDAVIVDISAEVAALEKAQNQEDLAHRSQRLEAIGQLTGGVAHDFNNILAVIMGNLELLRDETDNPDQRSMIDAGLEASHRGAELTRSMLAFARRARLTPEPLDLNVVALHAKNWMRRALPESVQIETSLLAGLWPAKADAASLESALLNLILNARDAVDGHGKVTIETANVRIDQAYVDSRNEPLEPGRYVMLAVSDTGSGIGGDTLEHMFEPFFTTKAPGSGSGLGLSMVLGFVKQSGGTVQVYTELGQGTTFKLYFPASDEAPTADFHLSRTDSEPATQTSRILLAEDENAVRRMLIATLESAGYDVVAVGSGDAALAQFKQDPNFDLLVTDIVMPGELQGTNLARAIRETHPNLPMIFMSGYAAEATVHGNGLRPEDIRLMKPVPRGDLLNAVAQALKTENDPK